MELIWKANGETKCGRFYIEKRAADLFQLYDRRNNLAGGVYADSKAEAQELAQRIAQ